MDDRATRPTPQRPAAPGWNDWAEQRPLDKEEPDRTPPKHDGYPTPWTDWAEQAPLDKEQQG